LARHFGSILGTGEQGVIGQIKDWWLRAQLPKVLLFINLPQDLDMLLPLAQRLRKQSGFQLAVAVTDKAWRQSPRIKTLLTAAGITPKILNHQRVVAGIQPSLRGIQVVITASESTANPHKAPHTLTNRANQQGILTYTMQHGYENVGLTYFDEEYPAGKVLFASKTLFIWGEVSQLPEATPVQTLAKCVAVGCPKFVGAPPPPLTQAFISNDAPKISPQTSIQALAKPTGKALVVVFENLHWSRYSDQYRQHFLQDLAQTALLNPQITFLVKPHHSGLWLTERYQGQVPVADNLIIADPKLAEWEVFTAPALIELADLTITTPSTVAVDAARAGCPVAVVAYDLALPNFEPLPLLRSAKDWQALVAQANRANAVLLTKGKRFLSDRLIPDDAIERIIHRIITDTNQTLPN
jgi:hypothetical protein